MKIERLNENQIRCILDRADLEKRQLGLAELAFGSEKAKDFFQDMMQEAYVELGFEVENIPLMIEAIPVSMDCLILVVTKVEDPDELESRMPDVTNILHIDRDGEPDLDDFDDNFDMEEIDELEEMDEDTFQSDFDNLDEESKAEFEEIVQAEMNAELEKDDKVIDLLGIFAEHLAKAKKEYQKKQKEEKEIVPKDKTTTNHEAKKPEKAKASRKRKEIDSQIFQLEKLDHVITLSGILAPFFEGDSLLYKDDLDGSFYLTLRLGQGSPEDFLRACTLASDYGYAIVDTYGTVSYFAEHFTPIFEEDALYYLNQLNE